MLARGAHEEERRSGDEEWGVCTPPSPPFGRRCNLFERIFRKAKTRHRVIQWHVWHTRRVKRKLVPVGQLLTTAHVDYKVANTPINCQCHLTVTFFSNPDVASPITWKSGVAFPRRLC